MCGKGTQVGDGKAQQQLQVTVAQRVRLWGLLQARAASSQGQEVRPAAQPLPCLRPERLGQGCVNKAQN